MPKRFILMATALAAASPGLAQSARGDQAIVVTAVRLSEARRQLEDCVARRCPPLEDIASTLRYAEALFVGGDYRRARGVLRDSLGRNRGAADRYPEGVAGLYRAHARISIHEGDSDAYRRSTYGAVRALREGLPNLDPRVLGARLEAAEMHVGLGEAEAAERAYRTVARQAREIGRADLAALADLRRYMLAHQRGHDGAREQIESIARLAGNDTRIQQLAARITLARIDRRAGRTDTADQLIADLARAEFGVPTLVHAPPIMVRHVGTTSGIGQVGGEAVPFRSMTMATPSEAFDYWADVGFWVHADGRVDEVEVLRAHGPEHWLAPVVTSIAGRIYAPAGTNGAGQSQYRVERYTYTSLLERRTDSRIAQHSAQGRIEMIDLTAGDRRRQAVPGAVN